MDHNTCIADPACRCLPTDFSPLGVDGILFSLAGILLVLALICYIRYRWGGPDDEIDLEDGRSFRYQQEQGRASSKRTIKKTPQYRGQYKKGGFK